MIFKLTAKNCKISDIAYKRIENHLRKISKSLPHEEGDLVVFRLNIKKNIDKYHPPKIHHHRHKSYTDTKLVLAFFEGSMAFRLDKNKLHIHFKGKTIDECLNLGFERIYKEIEKFKDTHFPAESEYPDHSTIRGVY